MSWILSRLCCCPKKGDIVDKKGPFGKFNLDVAGAAEQADGSETVTPKEHLGSSKLMKKELETVHKEMPEVLQDNLTAQSLEKAKSPYDQQCTGMNEVLEMIRNGVSLRRITKVHKDNFQSDEEEPQTSDQAAPELHSILKKRRECSEKCVSDTSVKENPVDTAVRGQESPWDHPGLRQSPRQNALGGHCQVNEYEEDGGVERASCNGDGSSTASILPLCTPLDQGQEDWTLQCSCPESSLPVSSMDTPSVDNLSSPGSESPQEELSACPGVNRTNAGGEDSEYGKNPDSRQSHDHCFLSSTNQSPLQEHLDLGKESTLGLKATRLPESMGAHSDHFVHFVGDNLSHEESSSLVSSDTPPSLSCVGTTLTETVLNLSDHPVQFVLLHDMKPQQVVASEQMDGDRVPGRRVFRILESLNGQ
ncbi:uncharacterized protein LOC108929501 [Scleropages formosus]|uniref:uncharacterized protein LOC108929501 n=1 Tax=Scleropages formosus TaxID=113540 RepID=UPI0008786EFC|nr:uncharacterized protein LOC108929501 [Scleropages formosus]